MNFHSGSLLVRRSYGGTHLSESTKTGRGQIIPIGGDLLELFEIARKKRRFDLLHGKECDAVFMRNGIRLSQNSYRNTWKLIFEKTGLEYRKNHTIRRTTANRLLSQGFSPKLIAEISADIVEHLHL